MCYERFDLLGVSRTTDAVARTNGWSKGRVWQFLWEQCRKPVPDLLPCRDGGDGLLERTLASHSDASNDTTLIQKFRAPRRISRWSSPTARLADSRDHPRLARRSLRPTCPERQMVSWKIVSRVSVNW
jgi:hypothetical protein